MQDGYIILKSLNPDKLAKEVAQKMQQGWRLAGGVAIIAGTEFHPPTYVQALCI